MNQELTEAFERQAQTVEWQEPPIEMIDAESLSVMSIRRQPFIIDRLLKPGLAILAGAPKLGKSWLVLHMCQQIASGEPLWGLQTVPGAVLYIALEDSRARLQDRIQLITDTPSENLLFATSAPSLADGLEDAICYFKETHPDAKLVVIDTFQKIRSLKKEMSYANDYTETTVLKNLADQLGICILLVHHTRKMGDSDTLNEISGTNGIAGCADTLMVLKKPKRTENKATLYFTGRDITDRELSLELDRETCVWNYISGELPKAAPMPREVDRIWELMRGIIHFDGSNSDFAAQYSAYYKTDITPAVLKRIMNRYRFELEDRGVTFISLKTNKKRLLSVVYSKTYDNLLNAPDTPEKGQTAPIAASAPAAPAAPADKKQEQPDAPADKKQEQPDAPPDSGKAPVSEGEATPAESDDGIGGYDRYADYYADYDENALDFDSYDGYIPFQ